ncbi:MAG: hypothetical protein J6A49_10760 [Clostridia bacterium]|nr:hypothetical protein [Clostridia bacterium]
MSRQDNIRVRITEDEYKIIKENKVENKMKGEIQDKWHSKICCLPILPLGPIWEDTMRRSAR